MANALSLEIMVHVLAAVRAGAGMSDNVRTVPAG
jgi:hypothetical protein